jgi:hypothetical protein
MTGDGRTRSLTGMLPTRFLPAALTLVALAAPAAASAAQTLGSPLDPGRGTVDGVGCSSPCTLVQDRIDGVPVRSGGGIITSWKALAASGSTVTLRTFARHSDGSWTALDSGKTIFGDDTVQTISDHIAIPAGATIGADVDGHIGGIATGGSIASFEPVLANGASGTSGATADELILQATVEPDADHDGLGDETEDPSVPAVPDPQPTPSPTPSPSSGGGGGSSSDDRGRHFTVGPTALLVPGRHPVLRAYASNGLDDVTGRLTLKVGGRRVAAARVDVTSGAQDQVDFRLSKRVAHRLARRSATAVVAGNPHVDGSGSARLAQRVRVVHGGSSAYDGTYRGSGPLVIVVRHGVVESATKSLLLFSTRDHSSLTRLFSLPEDGPVVVGRNGKVKVHGDWKADEATFKARFRRNGTVKGYLSLWHTELGLDSDGMLRADPYLAASNWTAARR